MGTNQRGVTLEHEPAEKAGDTTRAEGLVPERSEQIRRSQMAAARAVAADAMGEPAPPSGTLLVGAANDPLEHEAEAMARHVVQSLRSSRSQDAVAQRAATSGTSVRREAAAGPNNTGLPDNLKTSIERLSGISLDDVKVHYNSANPAALQAGAFSQGPDIHLAPGQERHLAHEAWHVVQQRGGVVPPTIDVGGAAINDDAGLESEADMMGGPAAQRSVHRSVVRRSAEVGLDGGHVSADVDSRINSARGGGKPIDPAMRRLIEPQFGHDFSNVGIHTGAQAAKLTEAVGAQAFAIGRDVFFAEPSMANDVGLLSHELTHVVQQGGAGPMQRKMWPKQQFSSATWEGYTAAKSDAQTTIEDLIDTYIAGVEKHGVVAYKDNPAAINLLLNMELATKIWIEDHIKDIDNGMGGVTTVDDPKRPKRMAGMRLFQTFVRSEIKMLQDMQAEKGDDVTVDISSKSDKLIKYEDKKQQASSVLENLGGVVSRVVPNNGDSGEVEVAFKFPVEPTGVGFLGGRFKVEAAKDDDMVKVRMEMAVTGGADIGVAEIKGEMGGYLESQAKSGADAMALVSYGLYRRFRESAYVPSEVSNYLWGGNWGSYGKVSADQWSRKMEERMFTLPTPDRTTFDSDEEYGAAMATYATELTKIRDNVYVESGGLVGVSASVETAIVSAEAAAQGLAGKRIDMTSLENTKGGAGAENKRSTGVKARMAGAVSGGTRGAEAKVSRGTVGFKLSEAVSGNVPGFTKLEGSTGLSVVYINDGKGGGYELQTNELEYALKGEIPFQLLGPGTGALMAWLSSIAATQVNKSINKVEDSTPKEEKGSVDRVKAQLGNMASAAMVIKDAATPVEATQEGAEESGLSSAVGLKISLTLDGAGDVLDGAIELSRYDDKELKIPKVMEAKVSRAKRIVKFSFNDGTWS